MPEALIFIIPLLILIVGVGAYYAHVKAKQRREELSAVARRSGWRFEPARQSNWESRYSQFDWFTSGHSRYAYNLLHGSIAMQGQELPCTMGDYTYTVTTGSGDDRRTTTYVFSFLLVELPFISLPNLAVRREGIFDRFSALLGFDDIDFESEEFSRQFHVKSSDKRFAYDLVHPEMIEFLLHSKTPSLKIERGVLCVRSDSGAWSPQEFVAQAEWCEQFLNNWPRHLLADLQSRMER